MNCTYCQKRVAKIDVFCRGCGGRLTDEDRLRGDWGQLALDSMPGGIFVIDGGGRIHYWNRVMKELSGLSAARAHGRLLFEALPQLEPHREEILEALSASGSLRIDCDTREGGHQEQRDAYCFRPLIGDAGPVGALGLVEDAAERIRLDNRLIRSERLAAIGELAAGIAHNFNNILAAVGGDAQLLKMMAEEQGLEAEFIETAQMIYEETMRGGRIANDLLSFAHGSEAKLQIVEMATLMDDTVRLARNHPGAKRVTIEQSLKSGAPQVEADPDQLHQVFFNIILNALQAMPNGGVLTITGEIRSVPQDRSAALEIKFSDTGVGISEDQLRRIFHPFFSQRSDGTPGSGLGLSVSLSMVRSIGGDIRITSAEGLGTVVCVSLPILERRIQPRSTNSQQRAGRVLVVDEEANVRRTLTTLLVRRGYEVGAAEDGEAAIARFSEALDTDPYDLVLLDLVLPRLDGLAVTKAVRDRSPDTPVIVLSGVAAQSQVNLALERGARFAFNKPVNFVELLRVVDRLVGSDAGGAAPAAA